MESLQDTVDVDGTSSTGRCDSLGTVYRVVMVCKAVI